MRKDKQGKRMMTNPVQMVLLPPIGERKRIVPCYYGCLQAGRR